MSYDIYLYRSASGIPNDDEADALIGKDTNKYGDKEVNPAVKLSIVQALTAYDPTLEAIDFLYGEIAKLTADIIAQEKNKFDHIQIHKSDGDFNISITVYDNHVIITTPYFHTGANAKVLFKDIKNYIRIIRETAGYFVYDPQTGEVFDPAENAFEGLDNYLGVSEHLDEIFNTGKTIPASTPKATTKKNWWQFWRQ